MNLVWNYKPGTGGGAWDEFKNSSVLHIHKGLVGSGPMRGTQTLGTQTTEVVCVVEELTSMEVQGIACLDVCPEGIDLTSNYFSVISDFVLDLEAVEE